MAEKVGNAAPQVIFLPAPHATESSSNNDDEDGRRPAKSFFHGVLLNNNNGDEIPTTKVADRTRSGGRRKFPGAYRRSSGRWSSEIRDPFINRRIWLGTFDTPEEASNAFAAKKLEFRERKEAQSGMNPSRPECESARSEEQIDAGRNWSWEQSDAGRNWSGEQSDAERNWSGERIKRLKFLERKEAQSGMNPSRPECESRRSEEQIDAGENLEPILIDNNEFLAGKFSNLDNDLALNKFPGACRRKSGRWSAEIRDPFIKRQIWLGTFDNPEEASNAYAAKKLDFRQRKVVKSYLNGTRPKCDSRRSGEHMDAGRDWSGKQSDAGRDWSGEQSDAGRNMSGEQNDAGRNWSGEQNDAGRDWEPILIDSNKFLLGEISNLDDNLTALNKFPGACLRKSGKWSAEIRDPFTKRQIRLGRFDTPEEASNAYAAKKLEFRQRKETKSYMDRTRPECDSGRSGEQIDAGRNWSGEQSDAGQNWSGEQSVAGRDWEPILIDSNGFLLGEFSNLDDDLRIS